MSAAENTQREKEAQEMATTLVAVEDTMERLMKVASAENVFAKPIQKDDMIIIPAAEVMSGMGLGAGFGMGMMGAKEKKEKEPEEGAGGGGGGGGRVLSRPVAVVVAADGSVRVEPIIDKTKIALTAIITNGILGFLLIRLFRRKGALRKVF